MTGKRVWQYGLTALLVLTIVGFGATLVTRLVLDANSERERRISLAATATHVALPTMTASPTMALSPTPSPLPTVTPVLIPTAEDLMILPTSTPQQTLPPGILPKAILLPQHSVYDLVNFLVIGSDRLGIGEVYRTDVIVIISVNRTTQTVNLLSVPRDLYVYIPGWGMARINTAELYETQIENSTHRLGLLAEAVEYNLGVRIDHLARVDFESFEALIDMLGGVTIPVDCAVTGYQPSSSVAGQWEPFTLEPGIHHLNGAMALWYARQRIESSDFDRNRRQQIILRAVWNQIQEQDLVSSLPALWSSLTETVDTDLTLEQVLSFIPLLLTLDSSRLESHFIGLDEVNLWVAPGGANVLVIDPQPFARTLTSFLTPPTDNHLVSEQARVGVLNGSAIESADRLAAAQLQWKGLVAIPQGVAAPALSRTTVYDYTGRLKGSSLGTIQEALGLESTDFLIIQDETSSVDFTVVLGENYRTCVTSPWEAFSQPD